MNVNSGSYHTARREPFLDEPSFQSMLEYLEKESIPQLIEDLNGTSINPANIGHAWYDLGSKHLNVGLLKYSGGRPVPAMIPHIAQAVAAFDCNLSCNSPAIEPYDLAIQTYYVEALWLLSLTFLLLQGDRGVEQVANFYAADETNDGADELFELVLAKLGRKSYPAQGVIHEDPYQLLLDCVKAEPAEQPVLMTRFLKRWYKGQKECDWWGLHIPRKGTRVLDTGFFGYWAFEAALVTFLWEIDDSSYRDLPHYPKDLIDYARQNFPLRARGGAGDARLRCEAGQPCPKEGYWLTPAKADSRRFFKQGETMPSFGGNYGDTIWQFDPDQG